MTDITELAQLRAELSNPAIGSKDHLRKLALSLVEALEKAQTKNELVTGGIAVAEKLRERIAYLEKRLRGTEESLIASTDTVAELESRTVVLPEAFYPDGDIDCPLVVNLDDVKEMLTTTGINWEAE